MELPDAANNTSPNPLLRKEGANAGLPPSYGGANSCTLLRVAFFTPHRVRCGISDYSDHLLRALRTLPDIAEVHIVEPPPDAARAGTREAIRRFRADDARFRALGERMNADQSGSPADVAHVQHQYFFFGGVAPYKNHACAFLDAVRIPLVMTVHEIVPAQSAASTLQRLGIARTNRANFLHPAIRQIIVHTQADREQLAALGVPPERLHVLVHGVPPAAPLPDSDNAKQELGLEGWRVLTLFGFLSAKKGHRLALEALPALPNDVALLFAGDRHPEDVTDYVPNLRADIEARGLADRVRITGYLPPERIPTVMAATDAALAPFLHSSGSGSLANLLAYARPIVASDIPPHQEIAAGPFACLALFHAGDAADLARMAAAVLTNAARRSALQTAARAYADRYSYDNMARETARIYRLAIATHPG